MRYPSNCCYTHCSVTVIEGTVQSLLENSNNVIIGVQYKDKQTSQVKVNTNQSKGGTHLLCFFLSRL